MSPIRAFAPVALALGALSCAPTAIPPADSGSTPTPPAAAPAPPPAVLSAPATYVFEGRFTAPQFQDGPRSLRAVFTPTDRVHHWNVVFHFRFNGAQHRYRGTAEGQLTEGPLRGTVRGTRRRTFTFAGHTEGGAFQGTHAEISRGGSRGGPSTGTLNLWAEDGSL